MSNTVGQITVKMRAEIAEFQSDMGRAGQIAQQTSAQMNRQIRTDTREAKESLEFLGEAWGVHLPRAMRRTIAEMEGVRDVASAAFGVSFALGFASVVVEK